MQLGPRYRHTVLKTRLQQGTCHPSSQTPAAADSACCGRGMKRHLEETPMPLGHTLAQFSPCVPVRFMCGCVATGCRRLATAPAAVYVVYRTTGRWAAWIKTH